MTTQTTQNLEIENFMSQVQNLIKRSIVKKRTTVIVVRYRSSDGYYNYQTKLVIIIKPKLEWEEEETLPKLVDIPISIFDGISLDDVESVVDKLEDEDVYIEKISFF